MPAPVLIGKRYDAPEFVLAVFAAGLGVLGGAWLWWLGYGTAAVPLLGVGAAACAASAFLGLRVAASQRWLTATDTGLVLADRQGNREFADEDLTDLGVASRSVDVKGQRRAFEHKCHLVLQGGGDPIVLKFTYTPDLSKPDPLADFFARNLDRLTERAGEAVA